MREKYFTVMLLVCIRDDSNPEKALAGFVWNPPILKDNHQVRESADFLQ